MSLPKLWTGSYIAACTGNFLMCFAFYLLLPVLPLYLMDMFQATKSVIGIVLSCYTVAALCVRPFSGYILDKFRRKPIYLGAYLCFVLIFVGYAEATLLFMFVLLRIFHGLTFGLVTTAGNTVIVDIMPSERRGEGLGYYGVANNLAMAVGPMTSLFMVAHCSYNFVFYFAFALGVLGFLFACMIKMPNKLRIVVPEDRPLHSYDRFFLVKGLRAGLCLLLLAVPYGMTTSYIAIYGRELGIESGQGIFFSLMAVGLIASRLFAGKLVDKGMITKVISVGSVICCIGFYILSTLSWVHGAWAIAGLIGFFIVATMLGVGYGMMFPAYNTLFVNLAPHNRRATASSTYLTSWDVGIGIGLVLGGKIGDTSGGLALSYFTGAVAVTIAVILFAKVAGPHFNANKLR